MTSRLHLLCAPFPSPQGTQAAVAAMLEAELSAGIDSRLVTYDEAYGTSALDAYVTRLPRPPLRVGPRSGPSLARVAHDTAALAWLARSRTAVFAHNVEAAWVAAAARVPYVYVAHTSMRHELATYGGPRFVAERLGDLLDRVAVRSAVAVVAIAPSLAENLAVRFERSVGYVALPWTIPSAVTPDERRDAREALELPSDATVLLHAGNLDGYQGIDTLLRVARRMNLRTPTTLLVATESDATTLRALCDGVALRVVRLAGERQRRLVHAAADVTVIARSADFGLPVKLLEAMARGVPTVATRTSCAGLKVGRAVRIVPGDDCQGLADAALELVTALGGHDARRARSYVAIHHANASYLESIRPAAARLTIAP